MHRGRFVVTPTRATAFVGLSHLGLVSAAGWASFERPVLAVDPDAALVQRIEQGILPVVEPGLPELLARSRANLSFSADLTRIADCELVIVARDVPTGPDDVGDLSAVTALVDGVAPHLRPGATLVVMSQVTPGFTRQLRRRVEEHRPDLRFELYYLVETLIVGDAVRRTLEPERFILGCADAGAPLPAALAEGLAAYRCPILPMRYESAELTKTAINLYLVGSVSYANTLADFCEAIEADWWEMIPALRLDKRIGAAAYLRPGLGVAGGNLERDMVTLVRLGREHGVDTTYLDTLVELNRRRLDWVHRQLENRLFGENRWPTVALWGLAYKRDTDSIKNSPALKLAAALEARARVRAWDPLVRSVDSHLRIEIAPSREAALDGADCLAIMTDWPQFKDADLSALPTRMRGRLVVDCVGALTDRAGEIAGLEYVGMGR